MSNNYRIKGLVSLVLVLILTIVCTLGIRLSIAGLGSIITGEGTYQVTLVGKATSGITTTERSVYVKTDSSSSDTIKLCVLNTDLYDQLEAGKKYTIVYENRAGVPYICTMDSHGVTIKDISL